MFVSVLCDCWSKNADSWVLKVIEFVKGNCDNLGDFVYVIGGK